MAEEEAYAGGAGAGAVVAAAAAADKGSMKEDRVPEKDQETWAEIALEAASTAGGLED